jgi:ferritin-like metal-binding protein YciE
MNNKPYPSLHSSLELFFHTALKEIYWSEQHLVNVLKTMTAAATDSDLKDAFSEHREQTLTHVQRLEKAFELLGQEPMVKFSKGLQGLFDEGWQVIDETDEASSQRDVALIIAAQKVEHYEIACYGSMITLAQTLGRNDVAQLLMPTLDEEKQTDLRLTFIAESGINQEASEEDPDSSDGESSTESIWTKNESGESDRDAIPASKVVM